MRSSPPRRRKNTIFPNLPILFLLVGFFVLIGLQAIQSELRTQTVKPI